MRWIKMIVLSLTLLIGVFVLLYFLVNKFHLAFGGDIEESEQLKYTALDNFSDGIFINTNKINLDLGWKASVQMAYKYFTNDAQHTVPDRELPVQKLQLDRSNPCLYWFGHSAFLVKMGGKKILIDPMLGDKPSPFSWMGGTRFNQELPSEVEHLPSIDYVLISHDHYDHLDYGTIIKLKEKVETFVVPLGVGNHLERWGVSKDAIIEMNWWDEMQLDGIKVACTPARHFSGRKLSNRQSTLWASWVLKSDSLSLFFSGDSGYDSHFTKIGEKYGPFDIALMECGQYNTMWPDVHMFPNQTVQAGIDVQAKKIIPIHWGAFKLAMHDWNEPAKMVTQYGKERGLLVQIPVIGEKIEISEQFESTFWWE
jgi:L-ascorbate metabolism protein UlaG (beta-lactamase superfamily)